MFAVLVTVSVVLAWPIVITYMDTGLVPRFPTAILSTGLMLLAFLSLFCGVILDTVTRGRQEMKRMFYLNVSPLLTDSTNTRHLEQTDTAGDSA